MPEAKGLREELRDIRRSLDELHVSIHRDNQIITAALFAAALVILLLG